MPFYEFILPMPVSVNASHVLDQGHRNPVTKKWEKGRVRSAEYTEWIGRAGIAWRKQFPGGVSEKFAGRIRVDYVFVWTHGARGYTTSDIGNREKVLSDYLQKKFYENDCQIDEQHQYRRLQADGDAFVRVRVYEIPDRRYDDINLLFPK